MTLPFKPMEPMLMDKRLAIWLGCEPAIDGALYIGWPHTIVVGAMDQDVIDKPTWMVWKALPKVNP